MSQNCTIMLVDDDEDDQIIFATALKEVDNQIELKTCSSAVKGLEVLQSGSSKPSCIFLDLNLPRMHGFEFLQALKTSDELSSIPVIIYSTSSRDEDRVKANQLGAFHYLSKPTSYTELKREITSLLLLVSH